MLGPALISLMVGLGAAKRVLFVSTLLGTEYSVALSLGYQGRFKNYNALSQLTVYLLSNPIGSQHVAISANILLRQL